MSERLGIAGRVDVVRAERPFGFAYGWLRPRICLSTGLVDRLADPELRAVLLHERWHVARRDPARLLVARSLGAALGPLPPIRDLVDQFVLAVETAADRHVVEEMGHPRSLAAALLTVSAPPLIAPAFEGLVDAPVAALAGEAGSPPPRWGRGRIALAALTIEAAVVAPLVAGGRLGSLLASALHPVC